MDFLPLTIFPEGGLASSVITTVWVGVFVLCFFNLRFGWVLSGLVVPGYLVPLVIVKPMAALVITVEAVMAYALVWLFSEKLSRGRFPSLFGRDRFMGLILASIVVRLVMDGYLLPELASWLEQNFDRRFDWHSNLQSFGLVIISLMANQFWKPGLMRGMFAAVVTIGLTWLIVRYGLMELTNFRISGVSYLYEGLASSILASPKAYIILTLTAMIASQVNVRYGWDFSGILIPALIALQWYQPTKILTSFAEAIVIYAAARLVMKLPILANATWEGGRKLLLFFNISFAWKMALGWFVVWQGLEVKTTDFYGFGYLLSTLIAIKAHDKNIFPRLARSTLQVSLAGAVLGNIVGFTLSAITARGFIGSPASAGEQAAEAGEQLAGLVIGAVGDAHIRAVQQDAQPLSAEAAQVLAEYVELFEAGAPPATGAVNLVNGGWHLSSLDGGRIALVRADGAGQELLVFDPAATRDLAIVLLDPTAQPGLAIAALELHDMQRPRWLVIGAPQPAASLSRNGVMEVFSAASRSPQLLVAASAGGAGPSLSLANRSATSADIAALRDAIPGLEVSLAAGADPVEVNRSRLNLDTEALAGFARAAAPLPKRTDELPCRLPRAARPLPGWSELPQLAFLRYQIAQPMLADISAGKIPYIARATARLAGFALDHCRLGGREQWGFVSPSRDEGYVFLTPGKLARNSVISFRDSAELRPARVGAAVYSHWGGDALLIAPQQDSFFRSPRSSFDVIWQELVRRQAGADDTMTFQLRPRPLDARKMEPNVDIVISGDEIGAPPPDLEGLQSALRQAGLRPLVATSAREFAGYEARPGVAVRYFNQTGGRRFAFGWMQLAVAGNEGESQ
ncbi:poly-gamma-glutamate biosynthesis protein PgsC/CapC [Erythrobacteraceae bacterium E2-1 Yellow Sea]|nr:poly-gamma-glutamate biosynthesis protein PgsC/CapC [Erythrobacteraceae bacterium E2-1 Yellow Sea]